MPVDRASGVRSVKVKKRICKPMDRRATTASVTVDAGLVTGCIPARKASPDSDTSLLALLVDGALVTTGPATPQEGGGATFALPLPAHVVGTTLDIVAAASGRSILDTPVALSVAQGLRWTGWKVVNRTVTASFTLEGPAAPPLSSRTPVQVTLMNAAEVVATILALPDPAGSHHYHLNWQPRSLLPYGAALVLTARVGTAIVDTPLSITSSDLSMVGYLDPSDTSAASGWVSDTVKPSRRVKLDLLIDGRVVASGQADQRRDDVRSLGIGDGKSGFQIPFPKHVIRDRELSVGVVISGTDLHLTNSPYKLPKLPPLMGCFDGIDGSYASGWVVETEKLGKPLSVQVMCDGVVVAETVADLYRGDVLAAGVPTARCGFRVSLGNIKTFIGQDISIRIKHSGEMLNGSPKRVDPNDNILRHMGRNAALTDNSRRRLIRAISYRTEAVLVSIIMPVFDTPEQWLMQSINSVLAQWSPHWELICVDDGSKAQHVRVILDAAARHDARIRVLRSPENHGIAASVNFGLRAARGGYVTFLDHDDFLEPDAVYKLAQAAIQTSADLIYSDEAITSEDIDDVTHVVARPSFSYDYYLSHPYFVHMICVRTELARQIAGWDESLPISADVDFVLRMLEGAKIVTHVPRVLYRWRTHETSTGHQKKTQVMTTMKACLARHLDRTGSGATVSDGLHYNSFKIDWPDDGGEVLVIIPTKNRVDLLRPCIESIERTSEGANYRILVIDHQSDDPKTRRYLKSIADRHTVMPYTGPFNYAAINNAAVKLHGDTARYLLFLNNDVEAFEAGWIPRLRSLAGRKDVGAVSPLLLYGDKRIQHAGVIIAYNNAADHVAKFVHAYDGAGRTLGHNCILSSVRDYSAVTAACLMIRRDVFEQVKGFDESFVVGFNDTDLCLRIRDRGYKVLYDGHTVLFHHESATRAESNEVAHPDDDKRLKTRWSRYFKDGDPFYSPLLNVVGTDHALRTDPGCKGRMKSRVTLLNDRAAMPHPGTKLARPGRRRQLSRTA